MRVDVAVSPRLLVTGANGLLAPYVLDAAKGFKLFRTARRGGDFSADLSNPGDVDRLLRDVRPDAVIHTAGFTDVDGCQSDPARAFNDNTMAARLIAEALPPASHLVLVSTDQVYPDEGGPHREQAAAPVNEYGRSKLAGEQAACGARTKVCVVRTNFFGPSRAENRKSLSDFMIEQFSQKRGFTLFDDVLFSPLHMSTLALLLIEIVRNGVAGVFNVGSRDGMSKAAFGMRIAELKKLDASSAKVGTSHQMPNRAPRPHDLRLDVSKLERVLGRSMPTFEQELRLI